MSHDDFELMLTRHLAPDTLRSIRDKLDNMRAKVRFVIFFTVTRQLICSLMQSFIYGHTGNYLGLHVAPSIIYYLAVYAQSLTHDFLTPYHNCTISLSAAMNDDPISQQNWI